MLICRVVLLASMLQAIAAAKTRTRCPSLQKAVANLGSPAFSDVLSYLSQEAPSPCLPRFCTFDYLPVCSTLGKEYGNACLAATCGAHIACEQACPCPNPGESKSLPGDNENEETPPNNDIGTYQVTKRTSSSIKGAQEPPQFCTREYMPVCDVRNQKFSNACEARKANATIACRGECPCPDLLARLRKGGGVLLVLTEDRVMPMLESFGFKEQSAAANKRAAQGMLASLVVLDPSIDPGEPSRIFKSEAANEMRVIKNSKTRTVIVDRTRGKRMLVRRIRKTCDGKVKLVLVK